MINIIDYEMGNLRSVEKAFEKLGFAARVSNDPEDIASADKVVLPGVGAFRDCISNLREGGFVEPLLGHVAAGKPLLGICVGMQVMFESCEEADIETLGLFEGRVTRLPSAAALRVPHCGWNQLDCDRDEPLFRAFADQPAPYAYFVHSYAAPLTDATVARCSHGQTFAAAVRRGNVCGVQFHPERSAATGRAILHSFLSMTGD